MRCCNTLEILQQSLLSCSLWRHITSMGLKRPAQCFALFVWFVYTYINQLPRFYHVFVKRWGLFFLLRICPLEMIVIIMIDNNSNSNNSNKDNNHIHRFFIVWDRKWTCQTCRTPFNPIKTMFVVCFNATLQAELDRCCPAGVER